MEYAVKLNAVNSLGSNVRAFTSVTFGDSFKITNIAVMEGKEKQLFVSMPSFKSKERDEHNQVIYKDMCNPITKDFHDKLYDILHTEKIYSKKPLKVSLLVKIKFCRTVNVMGVQYNILATYR